MLLKFILALFLLIPHSLKAATAQGAGLIKQLKNSKRETRLQAIKKLGESKNKKAVEPLLELLNDKDSLIVWEAARSLGRIGDKRAGAALIKLLENKQWDLRWVAAMALGDIGDKNAAKALAPLKNDDHKYVRSAAQNALQKMGIAPNGKGKEETRPTANKNGGSELLLIQEEMPKNVDLRVKQKAVYPAQGTYKKYGYACGDPQAEDKEGHIIAFCCDAQTMAENPRCAEEDPESLALIGIGSGSGEMLILRTKAGRSASEYNVLINVEEEPRQNQ